VAIIGIVMVEPVYSAFQKDSGAFDSMTAKKINGI